MVLAQLSITLSNKGDSEDETLPSEEKTIAGLFLRIRTERSGSRLRDAAAVSEMVDIQLLLRLGLTRGIRTYVPVS